MDHERTPEVPVTRRWGKLLALVTVGTALYATPCLAQFPGMEPEKPAKTDTKAADAKQTPPAVSTTNSALPTAGTVAVPPATANFLTANWERFMGTESPYRPVVLAVLTLLVLMNLKAYLTRLMRNKLKEHAFLTENAHSFLKVWNGLWKFAITVLVIIAMSGSLRLLGLTAGFFGMMLGWSLQQPVTGIAAWLMIVLKKPFKIGDRVVIAGIIGDVTGISLTHVILNQVGGSIGGEERSGRGILIPNAILFQNIIINYTLDQQYMLDEVPVRLTFDSDWKMAKEIMVSAAKEVTQEIITATGEEPFIRAEFLDWGILVRLRYNTVPARRQELSTYIIEILLREFRKAYPKVRFAIPSSTIRYRAEKDNDVTPPLV